MLTRPTKTEIMLEKLAGPALIGWTDFFFKVFMGILAIPFRLAACVIRKLYPILLWLHWNGEQSIAAISERFGGRRD